MANRCVQVVLVLLAETVSEGYEDGQDKLVVQETLALQDHKVHLLSSLEVHTCILSRGSCTVSNCSRLQMSKLIMHRATHDS